VTAAALSGLLVLVLAGCTTPEPVEPTPTPAFSSEEEAFAAAEETYRAYVDALNQVDLSDPKTFEAVFDITTGTANSEFRKSLSSMHADGMTVSGETSAPLVDALDPTADESSTVQLAVCLDVSRVEVTDSSGVSAVDPNRVDVQSLLITMSSAPESEFGWLIAEIDGREGEPTCE
jgi:hypothetical protein